jgi:hypothetical protein
LNFQGNGFVDCRIRNNSTCAAASGSIENLKKFHWSFSEILIWDGDCDQNNEQPKCIFIKTCLEQHFQPAEMETHPGFQRIIN